MDAYQTFLVRLESLSHVETNLRASSLSEVTSHRTTGHRPPSARPATAALLHSRWLEQLRMARARARSSKSLGGLVDMSILLLSVGVPFLIGVWMEDSVSEFARRTTSIVAIALAILVVAQQFLRFDLTFAQNQRTADALASEGWQFIQRNGDYRYGSPDDAFAMFTERVEAILNQRTYEPRRRF